MDISQLSAEQIEHDLSLDESEHFISLCSDIDDDYKQNNPEDYNRKVWISCQKNRYLNGFNLPIRINSNSEYIGELTRILTDYTHTIETRISYKYDTELVTDVQKICELIIDCAQTLIEDAESNNTLKTSVDEKIESLFTFCLGKPMIISPLNESYAFRALAFFKDLQNSDYDSFYKLMMNTPLSFYRARPIKNTETITDVKQIANLPHSLMRYSNQGRFSRNDVSCLYLGTTSYVCFKELSYDKANQDLYYSSFRSNAIGSEYHILNLAVTQNLINGIYNPRTTLNESESRKEIQESLLRVFPLVIATSFNIAKNNSNSHIRYEYLFPQALMSTLNKFGIKGIAYISAQAENNIPPHMVVNLALPATDVNESCEYGSICEGFEISKPLMFEEKFSKSSNVKSYANICYSRYSLNGARNILADIFTPDGKRSYYGNTPYGKFDDYLCGEFHYSYNQWAK